MKFLIIQTASIGDVILVTPVLEKLHRNFPSATIDVCVKKGNESLFFSHPFISGIFIWNKSFKKYRHFFELANTLRDQHYDYVINLQRFASSGFLTLYTGAKVKIGFSKNPFSLLFNKRIKHMFGDDIHEIDRNLQTIADFTDKEGANIRLYPSPHDEAKMSQYKTKSYICMAPTSLWLTKQFPEDCWADFLSKTNPDLQVYVLGSKNDRDACDRLIENSKHALSLNLAGTLSFLESASLMRDAQMNFVNDSAPMHLASAVNAPTTAMFCSTIPAFGFGPKSSDSVVIETKAHLDCRPCGIHGHKECPKKHFQCAYTIDINRLLERIP